MTRSWKITVSAHRSVIEEALLRHEDRFDWDPDITIAGSEVSADHPDAWILEAWLPRKPRSADRTAVAALFGEAQPDMAIEQLPETDWVTASQERLPPIRAGQFHVHTPDHPPLSEPGVTDFTIPASQAFGTGHHETTAGCLAMLTHMRSHGIIVRNCADIGTGTGLLAFAALSLWPQSLATASDIDGICADVVQQNAVLNGIRTGGRPGEVAMVVADGMDHPLLRARAPYDLVMANILAGPLISLAQPIADALVPGGHLVLAGLLESQEVKVRAAYRLRGLRLAARLVQGDWSILWLRRRSVR